MVPMIASRFSDRNLGGDLLCQYADTGVAESRRFVTGLLSPGSSGKEAEDSRALRIGARPSVPATAAADQPYG
jgi:hypothetical protein